MSRLSNLIKRRDRLWFGFAYLDGAQQRAMLRRCAILCEETELQRALLQFLEICPVGHDVYTSRLETLIKESDGTWTVPLNGNRMSTSQVADLLASDWCTFSRDDGIESERK